MDMVIIKVILSLLLVYPNFTKGDNTYDDADMKVNTTVAFSYEVYDRYFENEEHYENEGLLPSHNGYGSFGECGYTGNENQSPGFFRAAIDHIFLIELYSQLNEEEEKYRILTKIRSGMEHLTTEIKKAEDCKYSWKNSAGNSPDTAWILYLYVKSLHKLPLNHSEEKEYHEIAKLAAESLKIAVDRLEDYWGKEMWENPKIQNCDGEGATPFSNNFLSLAIGSLSYYDYIDGNSDYDNYVKRGLLFMERSIHDEGHMWKVGGNRVEGCEQAIHYSVWNAIGIEWAINYSKPTTKERFEPLLNKVTQAFKRYYGIHNYFPERTTGDGLMATVKTDRTRYVLPISYLGDERLFNLVFKDSGGKEKLLHGNLSSADFHRLLTGLTGAMEKKVKINQE